MPLGDCRGVVAVGNARVNMEVERIEIVRGKRKVENNRSRAKSVAKAARRRASEVSFKSK